MRRFGQSCELRTSMGSSPVPICGHSSFILSVSGGRWGEVPSILTLTGSGR